MTKILNVLASWQVLLLALTSFIILGLFRKMLVKKDDAGNIVGGLANHRLFKMFLPLYPYGICLGLVFTPGVPLPAELGATFMAKFLYAIWCGWFSDKSYQVIKSILEKGFNFRFDGQPVAPPVVPGNPAPPTVEPVSNPADIDVTPKPPQV
jgi:hypothetical protein